MAHGANRGRDGHSSRTPVTRRIKQPTRMTGPDGPETCVSTSFLFGLAPGGVCRAVSVAGNAVRSYRTVSPLPRLKRNAPRRSVLCGTFPGVLSPPDVIRHRLSVEPGLSSPAAFRHWRGAAVRPTDPDRNGDNGQRRQDVFAVRLKKPAKPRRRPCNALRPAAPAASRSTRAVSEAWTDRQCHRRAPAGNAAGTP